MTVRATETTNYTAAQVIINVTVVNYKVMTVTIDKSNSNPETCCAYADDAVDMEPGSAEWDEFFGHYPVLFKDGAEVVKIDPNDFNQDIDGNAIDITSGNAGDVIIAFPRRGLVLSKSGNIITIKMTDDPDSSEFEYMAHKCGNTPKTTFYIGAYLACLESNRLRSLSGKSHSNSVPSSTYIDTYSKANGRADNQGGSGYEVFAWYQFLFIQCMYIFKYKNLNIKTTIRKGKSSTSDKTGNTNGLW